MGDRQNEKPNTTTTTATPQNNNTPTSSSSSTKPPPEISGNNTHNKIPYPNPPDATKFHYPNPPEATNPDPATLRDQWRYAIKQYSRWYSHAWGTAILAGISFFALGWIIKGGNPLPSFHSDDSSSHPAAKVTTEEGNEDKR